MRSAALLVALLFLPALAHAEEPEVQTTSSSVLRRWAWLPAGVGVVSTWAGAWLLIDAHSRAAHLSDGPERFSPSEAAAYQNTGERNAKLGVGALALGGAAITSAIVMYALGGSEAPKPSAMVSVTPNGAFASLQWSFP